MGSTILLGVSGGIAAYKSAYLTSMLTKRGYDVHVIMTSSATEFITPLTFRTLSGNPAITDMFDEPPLWNVEHIALAERCDIAVVAPATANIIGKMASGIADDMLTTTLLAVKAPILIAPSMNSAMYENRAVQENLIRLAERGVKIIEPGEGYLACGSEGKGRMAEPVEIAKRTEVILGRRCSLAGLKIIVTAGPTREAIDPVRFISNRSSGKMGYAIAESAAERGADVILISGPTSLTAPSDVRIRRVVSASEMAAVVREEFDDADIAIMAAAVADYRPAEYSARKIKKSDDSILLNLERTEDIASSLGKMKGKRLVIGFAAESENLIDNAEKKLESKNLDMIVANDISGSAKGFESDMNEVTILARGSSPERVGRDKKRVIADRIIDRVEMLIREREGKGDLPSKEDVSLKGED